MTMAEILKSKGAKVITIAPESPVQDAIRSLVEHGVGSLVVVGADEKVLGMLTERDVLRENARRFDCLASRKVGEIMTEDVLIGFVDDTVEYVMTLMTEKRIRHLPIMSKGKLVGLVSIGDLVKAKARQQEVEIRHLTDYIMGTYPS
jgi:CBS domain-containing protein